VTRPWSALARTSRRGLTIYDLLGIIICVTILLWMLTLVRDRERDRSNQVACIGNLKQLGLGLALYAQGPGDGAWPSRCGSAFLIQLWTCRVVEEPSVFICCSTADENGWPEGLAYGDSTTDPDDIDPASVSYAGRDNRPDSPYHLPAADAPELSGEALLADDFESPGGGKPAPNHWNGEVNVLYGDYHVDRLDLATDLQGRLDCLGSGGVAPLDALQNGPVPEPAGQGTTQAWVRPLTIDWWLWAIGLAVVLGYALLRLRSPRREST
jgi:hypothetical protein